MILTVFVFNIMTAKFTLPFNPHKVHLVGRLLWTDPREITKAIKYRPETPQWHICFE